MIVRMNSEKKKQNLSRKKIINSAIILFANKGFESTSTREICKHAGVNLSLIPYYFENKDGLYTSIIESILNYGIAYLHEEIKRVDDLNVLNRDQKIDLYIALLKKYADFIYSENVPGAFVILMIKEQVSNSKFSQLYSQKISILYTSLIKILASVMEKKESDKNIIFEVSSVVGQILSFIVMNRATLICLNQDFYSKDDNKRIKKLVFEHIDYSVQRLNLRKSCTAIS